MLDRTDLFRYNGTNTLGWRIGYNDLRVLGFELFELAEEAVVLGIGDFRIVEDIIAVVSLFNLLPEPGGFLQCILFIDNSPHT